MNLQAITTSRWRLVPNRARTAVHAHAVPRSIGDIAAHMRDECYAVTGDAYDVAVAEASRLRRSYLTRLALVFTALVSMGLIAVLGFMSPEETLHQWAFVVVPAFAVATAYVFTPYPELRIEGAYISTEHFPALGQELTREEAEAVFEVDKDPDLQLGQQVREQLNARAQQRIAVRTSAYRSDVDERARLFVERFVPASEPQKE